MRTSVFVLTSIAAASAVSAQQPAVPGPSFESIISLKSVGSPAISPDGKAIAYTVSSTDWKDNRYDTEIWLWREGGTAVQLTRTEKGSSTSPRWSKLRATGPRHINIILPSRSPRRQPSRGRSPFERPPASPVCYAALGRPAWAQAAPGNSLGTPLQHLVASTRHQEAQESTI